MSLELCGTHYIAQAGLGLRTQALSPLLVVVVVVCKKGSSNPEPLLRNKGLFSSDNYHSQFPALCKPLNRHY